MATDSQEETRPEGPGWIRRMVPYVRRHLRDAVLVFGAAIAGMGLTAVLPLLQKEIIDRGIFGRQSLTPYLLGLIALGLLRLGLSFVRRFGAGRLGIDIEFDMRNDIYDHLHRLDFARHDEFQS